MGRATTRLGIRLPDSDMCMVYPDRVQADNRPRSELNGLRVLVDEAVERDTIYIMRMPPEREDFATDEDYSVAYDEWWTTMHCWSGTIKNVG